MGQKCVGEVREMGGAEMCRKSEGMGGAEMCRRSEGMGGAEMCRRSEGRAVFNGAKHCREGQINLEYNQASNSHKLSH